MYRYKFTGNELFFCSVYFYDGGKYHCYSFDNIKNEKLRLRKLEKMVEHKFRGTHHYATIYINDKNPDAVPIREWILGERARWDTSWD